MTRRSRDSFELAAFCTSFDRFTAELGGGYWVTMRVKQVPPEPGRPHGLTYSMTLHRPTGMRVFGIDNAHPVPTASGPARKSSRTERYDHVHRYETIAPYSYVDPLTLVEDFWIGVNEVLKKEGVP